MPDEPRPSPAEIEALTAQQRELVRALVVGGPAPAGFDPARVAAARHALRDKRRRALLRAWPALPETFGERFDEVFLAFVEQTPPPRDGGALADGRSMLRWLERRGTLDPALRLRARAFDLLYRSTPEGVTPRRGAGVRVAFARRPLRVVMLWRWPGGHPRIFRLG